MTKTLSYTAELEHLISHVLLPVYDKYYRERGQLPPYTCINPNLLKQIKKPKAVARLFQPQNNDTK